MTAVRLTAEHADLLEGAPGAPLYLGVAEVPSDGHPWVEVQRPCPQGLITADGYDHSWCGRSSAEPIKCHDGWLTFARITLAGPWRPVRTAWPVGGRNDYRSYPDDTVIVVRFDPSTFEQWTWDDRAVSLPRRTPITLLGHTEPGGFAARIVDVEARP